MQENAVKTQADRLGVALEEIRKDVTTEDRSLAFKEVGVNLVTISRYLNGNVRDNDTAAKLLKFFKQRIANREKVIA